MTDSCNLTSRGTGMLRHLGLLNVLILSAGLSAAQDPSTPLRFEAASIRPSAPGGPPISGTTIQANRLRALNTTLLALIRSVYYAAGFISENQFIAGPDWIRTERWEINAVAATAPTRLQFNDMLRQLLADRFKVRVRRERRELPLFALLLARDDRRLGPGLTSVTVDCAAYQDAFNRLQSGARPEPGVPLQPTTCDTLTRSGPQGTHVVGKAVELSTLARMLTSYFDAPVLDRTGLSGQYDYELKFVPDPLLTPTADAVSLATALREQLGLRVERRQEPQEVLVIESAERPTAD
jgi:uncharacterized protein (TIGR03435 family)